MHPVLFEVFGLPINSYGFMIMVGFLIATMVAVRRGKSIGVSADLVMDVGIYSMIVGIVGAKINHLLQYPDQYGKVVDAMTDLTHGWVWFVGIIAGALVPYAVVSHFQGKRLAASGSSAAGQGGHAAPSFSLLRVLGYVLIVTVSALAVGCSANMVIYHFGVLKSMTSGFVFYGGLIAGVATGIWIVRLKKQNVLKIADLAAPCIMLGLAFGRVGCFLYGCCFGVKTDFITGVLFPPESPAYFDGTGRVSPFHVHPTQLYETVAGLVLFLILSKIWQTRKRDGVVLAWLGILYPVWRFGVEFLRGDNELMWFDLTFSQWVSVFIFLGSVFWLWRLGKSPASAPHGAPLPKGE